jgi:hypothetical protein
MSVFDPILREGTTHAAIPNGMASVKLNSFFKVAAPFFEAYRCHKINSDAVPELANT